RGFLNTRKDSPKSVHSFHSRNKRRDGVAAATRLAGASTLPGENAIAVRCLCPALWVCAFPGSAFVCRSAGGARGGAVAGGMRRRVCLDVASGGRAAAAVPWNLRDCGPLLS